MMTSAEQDALLRAVRGIRQAANGLATAAACFERAVRKAGLDTAGDPSYQSAVVAQQKDAAERRTPGLDQPT